MGAGAPLRTVYLVRHGEAEAGWGQSADPGLSDLGREQAAGAAATLLNVLDTATPDLFSSPLRRARQTAEPLATRLGVATCIDERVREIPSPVPLDRRQEWLRAFMRGRWSDQDDVLLSWRREVLGALSGLPDQAVVFTHFLVLNTIVGAQDGRDETLVFWPANASVTTLRECREGGWQVSLGKEMHSSVN